MKLSVIFPVYNERATVKKILDEVLAFRMDGLETEVIIVEGNSTDGTREVIKEYDGKQGVRVVYEDKPKGKGAAVRKGLAEVTGSLSRMATLSTRFLTIRKF